MRLGDEDVCTGIICWHGFWILHGDGSKNVTQARNVILNNFHYKLMTLREDKLIYLLKPKVINKGRELSWSK